jgi:hypothetical protein
MILISNGGNLFGPTENSNKPEFIINTINQGFDVKIDLWLENNELYLGDEKPEYKMEIDLLSTYHHKLWLHCHDLAIIERFHGLDAMGVKLNYFYLNLDPITRTSKGYNIVSNHKPLKGSIYMKPEELSAEVVADYDLTQCYGIISNSITSYQ